MKQLLSIIITTLMSALLLACAQNGQKPADKPGITASELVKVSATVEAIDHAARIVTLRGPQGNLTTLEVSEEARNLDQVEVGDTVEAEYYESVALFVQAAEGEPGAEVTSAAARTPKGDKPGMGVTDTVTLTATVAAIDYETRMITLQGPEGNTVTTRVDESATRFNEVKQGDQVVVRYTRAFAITVREP
jgi:hypothetical protein